MVEMVHEACGIPILHDDPIETDHNEGPNDETKNFSQLLEDSKYALYPGCTKFTKLSFIVRFLALESIVWVDRQECDNVIGVVK